MFSKRTTSEGNRQERESGAVIRTGKKRNYPEYREEGSSYSCLSASMGLRFAARQAG
jgi:hypothetical protein